MSSRRAEFFHRAGRWFLPAAVLALLPKCVLCLVAYAGLGAMLGLGGPELCGAPAGSWTSSLALLGAGVGLVGFALPIIRHKIRP